MGSPELPQDDQDSLQRVVNVNIPVTDEEADSQDEFDVDAYDGYEPLAGDDVIHYDSDDAHTDAETQQSVKFEAFCPHLWNWKTHHLPVDRWSGRWFAIAIDCE